MMTRVRAGLLAASGLAIYVVVLFLPLAGHLFRGGPAAWLEGDVAEEYWPDLVVLCRGLSHGHLPRWNPWEHGGAPFYADPQAGAYDPLNWALCALAGPSPSHHWADFRVVLHFYLGCLFMAAFLRGEGMGWPASFAGALLFPLTPFLRHNWELNLTSGFVFLPLVLALSRALARAPSAARGAALGVALALATLAGSPPALFYALLVAVPFGIHAVWSSIRSGVPVRLLAASCALAALLAAALSLPMLVPGRELASLSVRAHPTYAMIAEGGLAPPELLGVVLPTLNDHLYVGLLALALALSALRRGSSYPAAWLFAAVAAAGALLMLGDHTPLFRAVYTLVPGAGQFRDPTRYSALWGTSTLVLAAAGLDALRKPAEPGSPLHAARWTWARTCGLVALGFVIAGEVPDLDPRTHGEGLGRTGICLALGAVAVAVLRDARILGGAVALLFCVDLFPRLPEARHARPGPFPFPAGIETLASLRAAAGGPRGGELDRYRTYDEFAIHMRSGSRLMLRDFRGYQDPLSLGRYQKVLGEIDKVPLLLATFNVRWVLWAPHYLHGDGHHFLADPSQGTWAVERAPHVYEIPTALPAAYWMDGAEVAADADAALARVQSIAPGPAVVLEAISGEQAVPGTGAYAPALVSRGEETITVDVEAPAAGFGVINEAWYPGWEARVDGQAAPIHRANSLVMAVRVPAGRHRIALGFRPWQPRVLEPLAAAALAVVVGIWVRRALGRGRPASG
jgi:hypothetical protein